MPYSLAEIAQALDARLEGDGSLQIAAAAEPSQAGPSDLALALQPEYVDRLGAGRARAALLREGTDWRGLGLEAALFVQHPRYAMAGVTRILDPGPEIADGIHPSALIDPSARIGEDAAIGPFVVIARGVRVGPRARIAAHATIGADSIVGADLLMHSGARIGRRVTVGDRVILQANAVLGGDGFSYVTPQTSAVETVRTSLGADNIAGNTRWTRIHSLGGVVLGDDVEIGANSTVDSGTIRPTRIGRGTKIDNLVMIGHNVTVGEDCMLCGQVGISGSTSVGNRVVLAGQCGVNDNITIGDDVIAGGATKIFTRVPSGRVILGSPAVEMSTQIEINKGLRRLPRLFRDVASLKKAIQKPSEKD